MSGKKTDCPSTVDPSVWPFVHALLRDPGDLVSRLALADLYEERGSPADLHESACLRQSGYWHSQWVRNLSCYALWWLSDDPTRATLVADLPRRFAPRCWCCNGLRVDATPTLRWVWLCDPCGRLASIMPGESGWERLEKRRALNAGRRRQA